MIKRKLISLSLLVLLAGCQKELTLSQRAICTYEKGGIRAETIFEHDGVNVITQTNHNQIELALVEVSKEELEATAALTGEIYKQLSGVDYSYEADSSYFNETLTIDFSTASIKELTDVGLVRNGQEAVSAISIEATLKNNREMGMTCIEDQ